MKIPVASLSVLPVIALLVHRRNLVDEGEGVKVKVAARSSVLRGPVSPERFDGY